MAKSSKRKETSEKQWLFFFLILQLREKCSEISGKPLYGNISSTWFHHIYPKSRYPELRFCIENIIIVTPDEHNAIEHGHSFPELEKRKRYIAEHLEELRESSKQYEEEYLNLIYDHAKKKTNFFTQKHKIAIKAKKA